MKQVQLFIWVEPEIVWWIKLWSEDCSGSSPLLPPVVELAECLCDAAGLAFKVHVEYELLAV